MGENMARNNGAGSVAKANTTTADLQTYYESLMKHANLRTVDHAQTWSWAVLRTLGFYLDRGTKRKLAKALPESLGRDLTSGFWLLHFRNPKMTSREFLRRVALRGGNTDAQYARVPTRAVFHQVKQMIDDDLSQRVAETLSSEVGDIWRQA
jgi:uncharacterized protein (DUF2267 family)